MIVVASNCGCCGIKHIRNFPYRPSEDVYLSISDGHDEDVETTQPEPYVNWCERSKSGYTAGGEALGEIVNQIKSRRPHGMITANLAVCEEEDEDEEPYHDWEGVLEWTEVFKELGFKYFDFENSNSGSIIRHFYLTY